MLILGSTRCMHHQIATAIASTPSLHASDMVVAITYHTMSHRRNSRSLQLQQALCHQEARHLLKGVHIDVTTEDPHMSPSIDVQLSCIIGGAIVPPHICAAAVVHNYGAHVTRLIEANSKDVAGRANSNTTHLIWNSNFAQQSVASRVVHQDVFFWLSVAMMLPLRLSTATFMGHHAGASSTTAGLGSSVGVHETSASPPQQLARINTNHNTQHSIAKYC